MSAHHASSGLSAYGWDDTLEQTFTPHRAAGLVAARIVAVDRGGCDVVTGTGHLRARTAPTGDPDPVAAPCTGDWAALRSAPEPAVVALLPRRSVIVRASATRSSHGQALAANVDTAAIVVSLEVPVNPSRIERLLALAWESGALPVLVLTKADRSADAARAAADVAVLAPGVEVVTTSAATGAGLDMLTSVLTGTVVLLGPSGAGKSTLGNALLGADVLATGAVRGQDGKGRHTTVRRELVPLPAGGVLIDTPGLRGIGLFDADDGLHLAFAEIQRFAERCHFDDCGHDTEPGCAVTAAVAAGELSERRLDSYHKLQRENAWATSRTDARLRALRARESKAMSRFQRELYASRERHGRR
ncbi:ribosome small subunit-dependent GTPase A [Dactylosporangium siamense]|uniref:ribosome small subunit-dependent GTPase A n=1 Tax=Dactylosporangium siamense TaxID=685454 RepID=UPI0019424E37|nr:ribosome small subunit-dependent GTPase A [Dactylosporangium siamense]